MKSGKSALEREGRIKCIHTSLINFFRPLLAADAIQCNLHSLSFLFNEMH